MCYLFDILYGKPTCRVRGKTVIQLSETPFFHHSEVFLATMEAITGSKKPCLPVWFHCKGIVDCGILFDYNGKQENHLGMMSRVKSVFERINFKPKQML